MTAGSTTLHEEGLPPDLVDRHRAIVSMMEELEAVDWYDQRVAASTDPTLAAVLAHNRDEEKEHFCMTLEWLRRNDPKLDEHLRTYLFTEPTDILEVEQEAEHGAGGGADESDEPKALRVGNLRNETEGEAVNHLFRELAPITDAAWEQIEDEATRSLRHFLAGRKLIDVSGPHGWHRSSIDLDRIAPLDVAPVDGTEAALRLVAPLMEVRTPFTLQMSELAAADRGAADLDLDAVVEAARLAALAEDTTIFHGYPGAGVLGLSQASPHEPVPISDDYNEYPGHVAKAVATLRAAGVDGPFAVALGSWCYTGVVETTEHGGYPVFEHVKMILGGGSIVWAPAVNGAIVLSQRGDDATVVIGQDFAIGYRSTTGDEINLYLEESVALRVSSPEAAIALTYPD